MVQSIEPIELPVVCSIPDCIAEPKKRDSMCSRHSTQYYRLVNKTKDAVRAIDMYDLRRRVNGTRKQTRTTASQSR